MMTRDEMKLFSDLQAKLSKQRQEIARLTRDNKELRADKANLRFDLHKARAAIKQKETTA